jgi:hypothetical protein
MDRWHAWDMVLALLYQIKNNDPERPYFHVEVVGLLVEDEDE